MRSPPAVGFAYAASRSLCGAMLAVAVLALAAVWASGLPRWLAVGCTLFVVAYAGQAATRLARTRIRFVLWRADGAVELTRSETAVGGSETLAIVHDGRILGPLVVMSLRWQPRGRATLWLLPDNLDPDTRRRLRARLRAARGGPLSGHADTV